MTLRFAPVSSAIPESFASMTFSVYRHLLRLTPQPRHPEQGDTREVQPIARAAYDGDVPVGLVLGELPLDDQKGPEMLSLFTARGARRRGIGTELVAGLEADVRERGFAELATTFMTGRPSIAAVERILSKRGWSDPVTRTVTLRFSPEQALATPWFGRVRLHSDEFEIFTWKDLGDDERQALKRSQQEAPWIPAGLEPWRHDAHDFDEISSLGLRYRGEIVGWVINHWVDAHTVRFTCSYVGRGLGRRGRILPLYSAALERLRAAGCQRCMFVTPVEYENMVHFVRTRCAPWADFFGETKGSTKILTRTSE